MDHLKIPPGATHIRVPYKCTQFYDGGDFFDYPARQGWTKEQLLGQDAFGGRSNVEIEAFFQTWLYFGTLICVFKLHGIEIDPSEFLRTDESSGEVFVTTSDILINKTQAWRMTSSNQDPDSKEAKKSRKILDELCSYMDLYCGIEGRESAGAMRAPTTAPIVWPVAEEISMSMIALGYILGAALSSICNMYNLNQWGTSPMLKAKLLENGWCPLDVMRLLTDVAIDGHYYLALKAFPYDKELHRVCDSFLCRARTVNEETYVIKHLEKTCDGQCKHDMTPNDVVQVIENGGIPVVSWRKNIEGNGSGLKVEDASEGGITYVAISHVWADGLGNPKENCLPVCQLERIQDHVNAIFPEAEHPIRFWMDTLCIPVAKEYEHFRKKSIQMMRQIYRSAGAVLVLDAGLQKLPISSSNDEKAIAVYMSNWLHRLWTFQEGMLAQKLYFQLEGGPLYKENLVDDGNEEEKADEERGMYGSFQSTARSAALGHFVILRDVVSMKMGNEVSFPPLCHAIHQRATTRLSDEAICAATILDMSLDNILAVEKTNVPDEVVATKRMEVFYKQVAGFKPGIIFHHQKRLRTEGYRWAPKTIMGAQASDFARDLNKKTSSFKGRGLRVRYPGLILEGVPIRSGEEITVEMKHDEHRYRLQLFPEDAGDNASPIWDPNSVYAVIMFRSISARYPTGTDAIVGILKNPTEVHDEQVKQRRGIVLDVTMRLSCECRAWVEPLGLATPGVSMNSAVAAELLGEQQAWRVF